MKRKYQKNKEWAELDFIEYMTNQYNHDEEAIEEIKQQFQNCLDQIESDELTEKDLQEYCIEFKDIFYANLYEKYGDELFQYIEDYSFPSLKRKNEQRRKNLICVLIWKQLVDLKDEILSPFQAEEKKLRTFSELDELDIKIKREYLDIIESI